MHGGADYTPYEGFEVTGSPITTIVRGRLVVRDGELVGAIEHGKHVARDRSLFVRSPSA
jgi:dihydropyrimidinase